jgi:hypothetical protein
MHLIDTEQAFDFVDYLFEKMPSNEVNKLKSRVKSLAKRAPLFKSDEDEIDLSELILNQKKDLNLPKEKEYW